MRPAARLLPDAQRLHLQHGPSDLIIWAEGARASAYDAAIARFETIIAEIVAELSALRQGLSALTERPRGRVARRMHAACLPFAHLGYLTPMAAVAGAVADEVLASMTDAADMTRAYVNNGGDIALHLAPGATFKTAMLGHDGRDLGRIEIASTDGIGGIATSGRHGRSLSLGIADSVTALARSAAQADVAATMIANAVDLPGHPAISRRAARDIDADSDLGALAAVVGCGALSPEDCTRALASGHARAKALQTQGAIASAGLFLQDHAVTTGAQLMPSINEAHHAPA